MSRECVIGARRALSFPALTSVLCATCSRVVFDVAAIVGECPRTHAAAGTLSPGCREGNMIEAPSVLENSLETYLTFSESNRGWVYAIAATLVAAIAYSDWKVQELSLGFLYVLPILMASATLSGWQIVAIAIACGLLQEWFAPLHTTPGVALRVGIGAAGF